MTEQLTPQMRRLLDLMEPRQTYNPWTIQAAFYGHPVGGYGYVNAGRGHGTGSLRSTFKALERRGLVERDGNGWRKRDGA